MSRIASEKVGIIRLKHLSRDYYSCRLGPWSRVSRCRPGQFVHVSLPDSDIYFRRAMSIAAVYPDTAELEMIFKVFGRGTARMAKLRKGDQLDVLGPLGISFKLPRKNETILMIGGGVGFPPLYYLAQVLVEKGHDPGKIRFFYGGRTSGEIVERKRILKLGVEFHPATDDGSFGVKGLVTKAVEDNLAESRPSRVRIYSCGPEPMLRAVDELGISLGIPGQVSLEAPMPCGIGICLGCIVPLRAGGNARVCVEGPVFEIGEVLI